MKIQLAEPKLPEHGTLVVFVGKDGTFSKSAQQIDSSTGGLIKRAVDYTGRAAKQLSGVIDLFLPSGLAFEHLLIAVAPTDGSPKPREIEELGGSLASKLSQLKVQAVAIAPFDGLKISIPEERAIEACAAGVILKSYRFNRYNAKSQEDDGEKAPPQLESITLLVEDSSDTGLVARLEAMSSAVFHARDLVSEPANVLYPKAFAEECRKLEPLGIEVEILDAEEMAKLGMGAILGVGQGSDHPPYLAIMRWQNNRDEPPLALVGKGVCFDTGGISIKPSGGMEDMKFDMGGAGAVFGAMKALASRNAKANVVGVLGLAENMPSGKAQRPGDVVRAMSGKTIEVINTDAEGRLVLADALHYTINRFKPRAIIDLATLTGAVIVALGHEHAGLFANDETLAQKIIAVGEEVGETVWRLPLGKNYEKHIKSQIAEIKNVGRAREAGSTAGAVFLQQFVGKCPWAHLDIAGVAWTKMDLATVPLGATGFGVRLLDRLIAKHFEN